MLSWIREIDNSQCKECPDVSVKWDKLEDGIGPLRMMINKELFLISSDTRVAMGKVRVG